MKQIGYLFSTKASMLHIEKTFEILRMIWARQHFTHICLECLRHHMTKEKHRDDANLFTEILFILF